MGSFYVNYTVRLPDQNAVAKLLGGRTAYVSPAKNSAVVVFDEASENQDIELIRSLGEQLSKGTKAPVLAVLDHDDDMLWCGLFESGRCTDQYNSAPGYFKGRMDPPIGGDSRKLCAVFGRGGQEAELEKVLRADSKTYVFAYERHAEIVRVLGLPDYAVACGFRYIEQGELPEGLTQGELLKTR